MKKLPLLIIKEKLKNFVYCVITKKDYFYIFVQTKGKSCKNKHRYSQKINGKEHESCSRVHAFCMLWYKVINA